MAKMTADFPTAPPAYGLEGPSAGGTVEKSLPASHTEIQTLPTRSVFNKLPILPSSHNAARIDGVKGSFLRSRLGSTQNYFEWKIGKMRSHDNDPRRRIRGSQMLMYGRQIHATTVSLRGQQWQLPRSRIRPWDAIHCRNFISA